MDPNDAKLTAGLLFFGKITASMTHEFKNVLAVINEISGLFSDLAAAAEKGRPLDPCQISRLAGKMAEQIQRADSVAKRMNRFAHSVDNVCQTVDLSEMMELFAALTHRLSEQKCVSLTVARPEKVCSLTTDPYGMLLLLFLGLEMIWAVAEKGCSVVLSARDEKDAAVMAFSCCPPGPLAPSQERKPLWDAWLAKMKATAAMPEGRGELTITFSRGLSY